MTTALPLPKYHLIYLVLREQLEHGQFARGLPSELGLAEQFGAGRVTVRRALQQLADEGLIVREPGRGTRPAAGPPPRAASAPKHGCGKAHLGLSGLLENIVSMSLRTSVKVLEVKTIPASPDVAEALQLSPGARVQKAIRQRSATPGPISYITTYVPDALACRFGRHDLKRKPMLRLIQESGIELGRARQTVSARQADADVAAELEVPVGTALLAVRRLVFDHDDRPVQLLYGLYRPDRYQYEMDVSKVGSLDARISVRESLPE